MYITCSSEDGTECIALIGWELIERAGAMRTNTGRATNIIEGGPLK